MMKDVGAERGQSLAIDRRLFVVLLDQLDHDLAGE